MGGRGSYIPGKGIPVDKREYSTIAYIDGVPVVQWEKGSNNTTITYSNSSKAYYAFSKERQQIEKVYLYDDNHQLMKQIEFKNRPHFHYFTLSEDGVVGRRSHHLSNDHPLTAEDWIWVNKAIDFNKQYHKK